MWTCPSMNSGGVPAGGGVWAHAERPRLAATPAAPNRRSASRRVTEFDFILSSSRARGILRHDPLPASTRGVAVRHATSWASRQRTERTLDDAAADAVAADARVERQGRGERRLDLVRGVREGIAGRVAARWPRELQLLGQPGAGAGRQAPGDRDRQPWPWPQHAQFGGLR